MSKRHQLLGVIASLALVTAACGSDSNEAGEPAVADDTTEEAPVDATDDEAMEEAPAEEAMEETPAEESADAVAVPERVVSLSPTHTEIMFAIGAGDLLVAVDSFSNHPEAALELPNELSGFEPNVEAIASYEPDLVLIGGDFTGLGDQLAELDIASWDGPAATSFDDTYAQIEQLGAATGHIAEAAELVSSMQTDIAAAVEAAPQPDTPLSFYHELDPGFYSADTSTFIGQIYALFGLENIADADESESFGYPQLNAEVIIESNPDLIFLADTKCCGENAETVSARPGWDAIAAVQNGNVVEMDDDIASRWGPRIVDYIQAVATAIESAAVAA
jgi:cobalamin transport system substrate-binding protein